MIDRSEFEALHGASLHDRTEDRVGEITRVYVDDVDGSLTWAVVKTGMLGSKQRFVPLGDATFSDGVATVPFDKSSIKDAPDLDVDGSLDRSEEATLYAHYGVSAPAPVPVAAVEPEPVVEPEPLAAAEPEPDVEPVDDAPLHADDQTMTRSEEQLVVGTEQHETERVTLTRHVVTEEQTITVPLVREEVRIVREPVSGDGATGSPSDLGPDEQVIVLHEERPVVTTEVHEVERVRIEHDDVVEDEDVSGEVRREVIDVERQPATPDLAAGADGADGGNSGTGGNPDDEHPESAPR